MWPWFLVPALLIAACGKVPASVSDTYQYTSKFTTLAQDRGYLVDANGLTIEFANIAPAKEKLDCDYDRITIDSGAWSNIQDGNREAIMFHVLAHCLIGRGHRDGNTTTGSQISEPWSLMNSNFVPGPTYIADHDRYIQELFAQPFTNDTKYP
jgi:hypothetical protein